ncbi:MAG TPA: phosphate ABC transporter permease subunit PstC [Thermoanaerobaculia bacterium]|nr:phosphate ABC transporter permease subunit PstC [Thermoanaerobaculia bacterium]
MRARQFDWIRMVAIVFSVLTVATVCGIFLFLLAGSVEAWRHEGFSFLAKNHWAYRKQFFEAAAMIYGTAAVALIAIVLAVPIGLSTAIFSSEICGERSRLVLKFLVELLAGVPSVVYGLLGVLFLRNWMQTLYEKGNLEVYSGDTLLTAGVLLAIMVLPTLSTLFDDAFRSVGSKYRDAARGLGLTRAETTFQVILPQALPGLVGALLLSFGRALGETIAVFLVVGRADNRFPKLGGVLHSLVDAGQTITSKLGGAETNIAVGDKLHTSALLGLALVLFVVVVGLTLIADVVRSRLSSETVA